MANICDGVENPCEVIPRDKGCDYGDGTWGTDARQRLCINIYIYKLRAIKGWGVLSRII